MPLCLIGMGANLGDPAETLRAALDALAHEPGIELVAASSFLATKPIGGPEGQGEFLNACATIRTELSPRETIERLLAIEASLGRTRRTRWEARKLDLDLLLYGDLRYRDETVEIPHPRMASRRFVLDPASEIAPEMVHPTTGWTVGAMARHLQNAPNVAVLTGLAADERKQIVSRLKESEAKTPPRLLVVECEDRPEPLRHESVRVALLTERDARFGACSLPVVVDFWAGESLLSIDTNSSEAARIQSFLADLPAPKLLIDLYVSGGDAVEKERWLELLRSHAPAPWIRVSATRPETAEVEILAALDAMQG